MRACFAVSVGVGAVVAAAACGSVPDVTFSDDAGGAADGRAGDAANDSSIVPGCTPTGAEICDDGIDNDCNGKTDCTDPACEPGYACSDVPSGWEPVGFSPATRSACTPGATAADLAVVVDGATTCACTCAGAGGGCSSGTFTVSASNEATCAVGAATVSVAVSSAACAPIGGALAIPNPGFAKASPPAAPSSCTPTTASPPPVTNGRACKPPRLGAGCSGAQACVPRSAAPLVACVAKSGVNACPAGFTQSSRAGSAVTSDSRACSGCTCNAPVPCSGGSVSLFDNAMCKVNGTSNHNASGIGGTCATTTPDQGFTAMYFKSTPPAGGCASAPATGATSSGALVLADEQTVCCR